MPAGMSWDRTTLKRRLRGARMLLAPATEYSQFKPGEAAPLLPRDLAEKVLAAYQANGLRFYSNRPPSVATGMDLQYLYYQRHRLTYDLRKVIYADAKRAGVPIVSPSERKHALLAGEMTSANPEVAECMSAIVDYVHIPPERLRQVAARWAAGDVRAMLETAPKSLNYSCRRFWTGHLERTVDFQTDRIIEAMETPGKVVAVAATSQLVAKDGILARLRAKGYTVADPTKPLEE